MFHISLFSIIHYYSVIQISRNQFNMPLLEVAVLLREIL